MNPQAKPYLPSLNILSVINSAVYGDPKNKRNVCNLFEHKDRSFDSTCPICLEEMDKNMVKTNCSEGATHVFHMNCIYNCLTTIKKCPLCRYDFESA